MKKKVLLLHCPGDKIYLHDLYCSYSTKANYYWSPSDLIILSGVLRGHELAVIDAIAERLTEEECERRIAAFGPEAIVFVTGTATLESDFAFVQKIKKNRAVRLIASSAVFVFEINGFHKTYPFVDAFILDITSPEIGDFIDGQEKEYRALAYRKGDTLRVPPARKSRGLIHLPTPRHELFKFCLNRSPLAKRTPFAVVIGSLGCPFGCKFCVSGSVDYQYRSVDEVLQEVEYVRSLGIREIMFNDSTFTVSRKRVIELCQRMIGQNLDLSWICNAHVATISEELIAAMREAGCHTVMIGVESGENAILERCAKRTTTDQIKSAFLLCKKHRVKTLAYFVIGLPGETRGSVLETIRFARELDPDYASFTVLTPDIGSELRREAIAKGRLDEKALIFDSTAFPVFAAGDLSKEAIWRLRQKAVRHFYLRPAYLFKRLTAIRSIRDAALLIDQARSMFLK